MWAEGYWCKYKSSISVSRFLISLVEHPQSFFCNKHILGVHSTSLQTCVTYFPTLSKYMLLFFVQTSNTYLACFGGRFKVPQSQHNTVRRVSMEIYFMLCAVKMLAVVVLLGWIDPGFICILIEPNQSIYAMVCCRKSSLLTWLMCWTSDRRMRWTWATKTNRHLLSFRSHLKAALVGDNYIKKETLFKYSHHLWHLPVVAVKPAQQVHWYGLL